MPGRESALEPEPGDPLGRGTAATSHAPALSERSLKKGKKGERRKKACTQLKQPVTGYVMAVIYI